MDYQDKHTESIVECAKKLRNIQRNQIDPIMGVIQNELSIKFPSLSGKEEDGTVDWSYDIINCESDDEVVKTLNRIDNIENGSWKCSHCGEPTFDVDIDYLFGYNHLSCQLKNDMSNKKENPLVESLKHQFDDIVVKLNEIQKQINELK